MREIDVETYLTGEAARRLGAVVYKVTVPSRVGPPDRILMWTRPRRKRGFTAWVEMKRPGGPAPRRRQEIEHERLRGVGQFVGVAYTHEDVDALLTELESWR